MPQLDTPIRPHLILYYVEDRHIKRIWKSERHKWKARIASEAFFRSHSHDHLESARGGCNRPKYPRFRIRHGNQAPHLASARQIHVGGTGITPFARTSGVISEVALRPV